MKKLLKILTMVAAVLTNAVLFGARPFLRLRFSCAGLWVYLFPTVNHDKTLEELHMTDQNDQSENNPSISGRVKRIIPTSGKDVVQPLSADRITAYLQAKELMFNRDDDGDVFINFDSNGFVLLATGEKREILVVRGAW